MQHQAEGGTPPRTRHAFHRFIYTYAYSQTISENSMGQTNKYLLVSMVHYMFGLHSQLPRVRASINSKKKISVMLSMFN